MVFLNSIAVDCFPIHSFVRFLFICHVYKVEASDWRSPSAAYWIVVGDFLSADFVSLQYWNEVPKLREWYGEHPVS